VLEFVMQVVFHVLAVGLARLFTYVVSLLRAAERRGW
jgi:hypothetical protein